jgi:hypothetical protein
VFTLLRLLIPIVLIVAVVAGSLTFVSRASCRSGTGHGKRETRWSLGAPGAKPDTGCRDQQTGLSYLLDQIGLG